MTAPREAVEAVQKALGCKREEARPGYGDRPFWCYSVRHGAHVWTDRGCALAVAAADAAAPAIAVQTLLEAAVEIQAVPAGYPNNPRIRSLQSIRNWLRDRADRIEAQP